MASALAVLAALAGEQSRVATGIGLASFGLGFGMVTQVLVVAVQNSVDRRQLGIATATTGFFRALGGAVGASVLGAVFAARAGAGASVLAIVDAVSCTGTPTTRSSAGGATVTTGVLLSPRKSTRAKRSADYRPPGS